MKPPVSVAVIAQDEEDRIAECLESASFADEVVVVDGGSRDRTVEIAESFGCKVLINKWPGFAVQKQYAADHCRNDWVLILDADERVSKELADKIGETVEKDGDKFSAFGVLRKNFFHKKWIRRCGWWPERVVRLVDRRRGRFSNHLVHEHWVSDGPAKQLDLHIEHHSFRNYAGLIDKMQVYSTLAANQMLADGRLARWWTPILRGGWMFFRMYFLEFGILEGFDGFMISLMNGAGSFMKYAKLRELHIHGNKS